ncbi:MAG: collagen-like protein [Massilia sp.]
MKMTTLLAALLSVAALTACEKSAPTVVTPTVEVPVAVPGPAVAVPVPGPAGAPGAPGAPGAEGAKGEPGKNGDSVIVVPEKSN